MELDKRIIEGKKPLTYFEGEQAHEFIGKECYFSDIACKYEDLDDIENTKDYISYTKGTLSHVHTYSKDDRVFENVDTGMSYRYCLPCEWVKEPEKKYRPLSYKEFWRLFDLGDGVCFRRKGQDTAEFSMFLGYEIDSDGNRAEIPGEGKVNLGGNHYTLAELFEYYELELDDEWQPFGVIDKQE